MRKYWNLTRKTRSHIYDISSGALMVLVFTLEHWSRNEESGIHELGRVVFSEDTINSLVLALTVQTQETFPTSSNGEI